jgi:chromosome segregation ATPase
MAPWNHVREPCPYCNPPEKQVELETKQVTTISAVPNQKLNTTEQLQLRHGALQEEFQKLKQENEQKLEELKNKQKAAITEKENLEKEIEDLKVGVNSEEPLASEQVEKLTSKTSSFKELDEKVSALEGEKKVLDGNLADLEGDIASIENEISNVEKNVENIENEISSIEKEIAELE